jgi:Undecaprenyl-phosphate galactose phosphotransferase WbaP
MVCADLLGILVMWSATVVITRGIGAQLPYSDFRSLGVMAFALLSIYLLCGLYPGIAMHPVDELRRLSLGTTLASALSFTTFGYHPASNLIRVTLILWTCGMAAVPGSRALMRRLCQGRSWWGVPTLILGAGRAGRRIVQALYQNPQLGLRPIGVLDNDPNRYARDGWSGGVPYLGPIKNAAGVAAAHRVEHAIVAMPGARSAVLSRLIFRYTQCFPHILVVPNLQGSISLWVRPRSMGGILGLEISHLLVHRVPQFLKRAFDILLALLAMLLLAPLLLAIYAAIRLESRGPALYFQNRLGRGGTSFRLWKFRSMYSDCDLALRKAFARDPSLAMEWRQNHKLRRDPRVTRLGKVIRKLSLDELPQLWNVLIGDMSLVGPRPIVTAEIHRYRRRYACYALVRPGITGLWQVSGRNNTSYEQRIRFDDFYVRNWSIWLDIYILAKTVRTVVTCDGAY